MMKFLSKLFDSNEKQLNKIQPLVDEINSLEKEISLLSTEELREKTKIFRKKLNVNLEECRKDFVQYEGGELERILDTEREQLREILPEVFATAREASKRISNHRHYDVQVMAGYFLFDNKITELFTGEGKTLAANMPLYLYALTGRGAHLVTVNDYLARRDAEWNGHILSSLGITVGAINSGKQYRFVTDEEAITVQGKEAKELIKEREEKKEKEGRLKYDHMSGVNLLECTKKEAYACDIVYGTNNEFGFDYLRDNMVKKLSDRVQGPRYFVIVDEADSILIDEARTPLIISTAAAASNDMYMKFASLARSIQPEKHYEVDEKAGAVSLSDKGMDFVEKSLGVKNIYEDAQLAYHLDNALKAKELYKRDDEYMVRDGEVMIVDEFTGRALSGRRYSEGLHQAIEAKEGVEVKRESRTMATITLQNYFRLYTYLSGMTATALTEAEEFASIYHLDTIVVPTNEPVIRKDYTDIVYKTQEGKFKAIVEDIEEHHAKDQPILVGTTSVEKSEIISEMLNKDGIKHEVLNAKHHEREAKIVSMAGQKGSVTIATNMAGRGTDIALEKGVVDIGGLYVIGSERHESRRIDNQLRGRSGRQGDPGESRFYVSFEDDLMRLFGGEKMSVIMGQVGMDDDMPIAVNILGKSIENAQKKVESHNYDIRKRLVDFDDVLNQQRDVIYGMRTNLLSIVENGKKDRTEGNLSKDRKFVKETDIDLLLQELARLSLSDENTWDIKYLKDMEYKLLPLEILILKKLFNRVDFLISSQLKDDMKIDNIEERKLFVQIKNFLTEELFEKAVKELGYKDSIEFFRENDEDEDLVKKRNNLLQLIFIAFVNHIYEIGFKPMAELSKVLILQSIDRFWMEHLTAMGDLREGISLRNLAQRDPLVEYKNEGYSLFDNMLNGIDESIVNRFFKVRLVRRENIQRPIRSRDNRPGKVGKQQTVKRGKKVGRNDPCPCGSGKKYKKCCYPKYE